MTGTTPLLAALHVALGDDPHAIMLEILERLHGEGVVAGGLLQEAEHKMDGQCATLNVVDICTGQKARIT